MSDPEHPTHDDGDDTAEADDQAADDEATLAADADDVSEFLEQLVQEPGAPMTEEGIINNP